MFLPIVQRELRTAIRRPKFLWNRVMVALVALVSVAVLMFSFNSMGFRGGGFVFNFTVTYVLLFCVVVAATSTADAISGERREGTLGLLFLTDLRATRADLTSPNSKSPASCISAGATTCSCLC